MTEKEINIEYAIHQLIGFVEAKNTGNVINLVENMGLTTEEWIEVRKDIITTGYEIKEELDEHFKTSHLQ